MLHFYTMQESQVTKNQKMLEAKILDYQAQVAEFEKEKQSIKEQVFPI